MAADNSPPQIRVIAITAFVAVLVLFGLKFVFDSYYVTMFEAEEFRKVGSAPPTALMALHAAEKKSLAGAPIPIDRAMSMVARGRAGAMPELAEHDITPQPSSDNAPLIGWALTAKPGAAGSAAPASPDTAAPPANGAAPAPTTSAAPALTGTPSAAPAFSPPPAPGSPAHHQ
jgi:hypothetical protein